MRVVFPSLAIVFSAMAGCGSPNVNRSTPHEQVTAKPDPKSEEFVRGWLAENSYAFVINHVDPNRSVADWEKWIDEGRKIRGVEPVLRSLLSQRDADVELPLVAQSLGDLGDKHSVPVLIDALDGEDLHLQIQSAVALGRLRDRRAVPALGKRLRVESEENVRANIVVALGSIGGPDSKRLLGAAGKDSSPFVAKLANEELAKLDHSGINGKSGADEAAER